MKRDTTLKTLAVMAVAALVLAACSQTTPAAGPAGPAGPRGPAGPAGDTAVEVRTFTVRSGNFTTNRTGVATATYPMTELTQAVVDGGIVTGYWDQGSGVDDFWWQLPHVSQSADGSSTVTFIYETGEVGLQVTGSTSETVQATVATIEGYRLRVVVLAP